MNSPPPRKEMIPTRVRLAQHADRDELSRMRAALWPESAAEEHAEELQLILSCKFPGTMPLVIFVAESAGRLAGFLEAGLRSYADGCDAAHAVGYVEGWYVREEWRRQGIGAQLLHAADGWARSQGCKEMASDTRVENVVSQRAHEALGFETAERSVLYRKTL
jgi:aminoglycoside 6'-N-acetyltransferase I